MEERKPTNPPVVASTGPKPPRCVVNFEGIPQELKNLDRWLVWKYEHDGKRWTKVPYQSKNPNRTADSTKPRTWSTFDDARKAYEATPDVDGIGIALTASDDIVGVDFDDKLDPATGEIDETTSRHLELLDSYTEVSPSGAGFRVILRGTLKNLTGNKRGPLEVYETARYLTITGNAIREVDRIPNRQTQLEKWHAEIWPPRAAPAKTDLPPLDKTEQEIIDSIEADAKNAGKYARLWAGDDSDYAGASEADLGFCAILHYHGANANQIDAFYRNSDRARDKWDEPRGDTTYGGYTINKALGGPQKRPAGRITLGAAPPAPKTERGKPWAGLSLDSSRYAINQNGVFSVKLRKIDQEWVEVVDYQTPIAGRPIWPNAIAIDVTRDDHTYVQLAWLDANYKLQTEWVPHAHMNDRSTLMNLNGAPVSYGRFARLTDWLADAIGWVETEPKKVITRPYWVNDRFIIPGDPEHEHIGTPPRTRGTIQGWAKGIELLLNTGANAYPGLAAIGFSAISPAVALLNKRRPTILYSHPSTSGKGAVINYATAIWEHHEDRTSPAGSTWRGVQDRATQTPDLPVFVDEAQQLLKRNPNILEDLLYFFGNGMSRVISSPDQTTRGGNPRNGVAFFAAEENVLEARQGGSQNRVITITHPPLPPNSPQLASNIERITRTHYGAAGPHIAALINEQADTLVNDIEQYATTLREKHPDLRGDDSIHLALMEAGLKITQRATGILLPIGAVVKWLAESITDQRVNIVDREVACLRALLQTITSYDWTETFIEDFGRRIDRPVDILIQHNEIVAFRGEATGHIAGRRAPLEINPTARPVQLVLRDHGFVNPAPDWARRGWIDTPTGKNLGWRKKHEGRVVGRFWRFTTEAFEVAGLTDDGNEEKETETHAS